jgi:cob(I)alamin adenosyltransferase
MAFFTGKGDKGVSYICGRKHDKTCVEIEALGNLDELNSLIGLIRSGAITTQFKKILYQIQEDLFVAQANVYQAMVKGGQSVPAFNKNKVRAVEQAIETLAKRLPAIKSFTIPGTTPVSAWFDYARTVARRAERSVLALGKKKKRALDILAYLNRLSSLLFVLARSVAARAKKRERAPSYE